MPQKAFLFDLNGTMIDDMHYHIKAWHTILNRLGATLTLEQTKQNCYGKNEELLERIFPNRFTVEERYAIGYDKETAYQEAFTPHLQLIEGLGIFLEKAYQKKIKMAIGSAAIMYNINYVLDGLQLQHYFNTIVSADDVLLSKPNPEVFLKCAALLQVQAKDCIVFEDSPKGVEAALRANMQCVAITTMHSKEEFASFSNIIAIVNNYNDPALQSLFN
jgi:beta-phosphoglucomutase